jgi:Leucine-rich repeat (LRR) protein
MNHNHLAHIDLLTGLTNLRVLNVASNDISIFPAGFTNLVMLKDFDCNGNTIKDLTNFIPCSSFTALQQLNLSGNELQSLPTEIGTLTTLEKLLVHENEITALPTELGLLSNIMELCLVSYILFPVLN